MNLKVLWEEAILQPSDEVMTKVIDSAPEGWVVVAVAIVAVLVVLAKWWLPEWRKDREGKRELERRRVELEAKAQEDADAQARERIRLTERQLDVQDNQTRALEAMTEQMMMINVNFEASASRSGKMGERMEHTDATVTKIDATTTESNMLLKDIRHRLIGGEGTD